MPERPRTQFLDLKSADFGPRQEEAGARIDRLGRPPPTELIQTHPEQVRREEDVVAELDATQTTLAARGRRFSRSAVAMARRVVEAARYLAADVARSLERKEPRQRIELDEEASLSLLPAEDAPALLALEKGTSLVVYLEIDAPPGWVAVRAPAGELGYLRAEQLVGGGATD